MEEEQGHADIGATEVHAASVFKELDDAPLRPRQDLWISTRSLVTPRDVSLSGDGASPAASSSAALLSVAVGLTPDSWCAGAPAQFQPWRPLYVRRLFRDDDLSTARELALAMLAGATGTAIIGLIFERGHEPGSTARTC